MSAPKDGVAKLIEHPLLTLTAGWSPDGDGIVYAVVIGEENVPVTKVEPWMLEVVAVAAQGLKLTRAKLEQSVLQEFVESGRKQREARKKFAALGGSVDDDEVKH